MLKKLLLFYSLSDDLFFVDMIIMALVTCILSGPVLGWMTRSEVSKPEVTVHEPYRGMAHYEDFREED